MYIPPNANADYQNLILKFLPVLLAYDSLILRGTLVCLMLNGKVTLVQQFFYRPSVRLFLI